MYPQQLHSSPLFHLTPTHILSQPLSVESDVGFGELKQRMIAQGEEVIKKYKGLVPESKLSDVCAQRAHTKTYQYSLKSESYISNTTLSLSSFPHPLPHLQIILCLSLCTSLLLPLRTFHFPARLFYPLSLSLPLSPYFQPNPSDR